MLSQLDAGTIKQLLLEARHVQHVEQALLPQVRRFVGHVTLDGLNTEEKESDVSFPLQTSMPRQLPRLQPDVPLMNYSLTMEQLLVNHALQDRIVLILIEILLKFVSLDITITVLL